MCNKYKTNLVNQLKIQFHLWDKKFINKFLTGFFCVRMDLAKKAR